MTHERIGFAGAGKIKGGVYESVRIAGAGKIDGDVEARTIDIAGSCKIEGNATAEEFTTDGSCKVTGSVNVGEMKTAGGCSVEGDVKTDLFKCSGSQKIGGCLRAGYARIAGSCRVGGDVEADKFISEGSFRIDGLLSADEIDIRLGEDCRVREIGGERIEVRRKDYIGTWQRTMAAIGRKGGWGCGTLETELIEGDEIELQWTKAKVVRGKRVKIGKGCEIERVEYSESIDVDETASVGEQVKS